MAITSMEELLKNMEGMKNQPVMASVAMGRQAESLPAADTDFPYWKFSGPLDADTSALCRYLHGKIFDRSNPDDNQWLPPVHINCRHWAAPVSSLEAGEEWKGEGALRKEIERAGAEPDKVLQEGHFIFQPGKYEDLKIPARASGRNFIIRNRRDPETGQLRAVIEWLRGAIQKREPEKIIIASKARQLQEIDEFIEEAREEAEELPRMAEYYQQVKEAAEKIKNMPDAWFIANSKKTGVALINMIAEFPKR